MIITKSYCDFGGVVGAVSSGLGGDASGGVEAFGSVVLPDGVSFVTVNILKKKKINS